MKFNLAKKTAVITGGGSGIGKAIAKVFAEQAAKVHILDLDSAAGRETVDEITRNGQMASYHLCNVAEQKHVLEVTKNILFQDKRVDILINNAGIAHIGDIENTDSDTMDLIYEVNIKGVYNMIYALIPHMKKKGGVIINMASVASSVGISDRFAYSMSKGAVMTMTYSVAKDYISNGIRCNSISPARVHTAFVDGFLKKNYPGEEKKMFEKLSKTQPIGRMGTAEEVANLALYLCSEEAAFITGTDFPIDGGFIKLNR